jgi:hypothetical protein
VPRLALAILSVAASSVTAERLAHAWPEALEQLRVAKYFLPPEEHERVDELAETADKGYQARFGPLLVTE